MQTSGVHQQVALDLDIGTGFQGGFLMRQKGPHDGTEGFDGPRPAFDLLPGRVLAESHTGMKFAGALTGILCAYCRDFAERKAALFAALPILENPARRATGPDPQ